MAMQTYLPPPKSTLPMGNNEKSCPCKQPHHIGAKATYWPLLNGLLIALLPKCPFCIMAYSSAITLCSGATLYDHNPTWVSWISIGLAALTLLLVLWNHKGTRTWFAAAFVVLGSLLIIESELRTGDIPNYYFGCTLLLLGVWTNGNLLWFLKKAFKTLDLWKTSVPNLIFKK
jgi:hypothetical protein